MKQKSNYHYKHNNHLGVSYKVFNKLYDYLNPLRIMSSDSFQRERGVVSLNNTFSSIRIFNFYKKKTMSFTWQIYFISHFSLISISCATLAHLPLYWFFAASNWKIPSVKQRCILCILPVDSFCIALNDNRFRTFQLETVYIMWF